MAAKDTRDLAIAQFIDFGYADQVTGEIKAETVRERNPWVHPHQRATLQWATKILFGEAFALELQAAGQPEGRQRRRNIIGGRLRDIGGSSILITKRRTI